MCGLSLWGALFVAVFFSCFFFGARQVYAKTAREPASSDLKLVHGATKLSAKRWIQSFTKDGQYYYYAQMTSPYTGNLRITRIKYKGYGKYKRDHMTLKNFGHATRLDCSVVNGVTYLWTGSDCKRRSDVSRTVSAFRYRKNATLRHHSAVHYKIPKSEGGYATNVYAAVSADSRQIAVRYTAGGKQYYKIYALSAGKRIDVKRPIAEFRLAATAGDFQGFDIYGTTIYTIEGSPRKSFLRGYDRSRRFQATKLRTYDYLTKRRTVRKIRGAKKLSFREPEGVEVRSKNKIYVMFVSGKLTDQRCNIYRLK